MSDKVGRFSKLENPFRKGDGTDDKDIFDEGIQEFLDEVIKLIEDYNIANDIPIDNVNFSHINEAVGDKRYLSSSKSSNLNSSGYSNSIARGSRGRRNHQNIGIGSITTSGYCTPPGYYSSPQVSSGAPRTNYVSGYTRSNGTVVEPYRRS